MALTICCGGSVCLPLTTGTETALMQTAESSAYDVAGTPKARQLAQQRAKRLYALADCLPGIQ